jgi:hypothetical protein
MIKSKPGTREEDRQTEDEIARKKVVRAAYLVPLTRRK